MAFILATTQFGMLLFLLQLKAETRIRRWLIINYFASVVWQVDQTIRFSLHPSMQGTMAYKLETVFIYSPALAVLVLSYLQILYLFLHQPYEPERRVMVKIVIPVVAGLVVLNAWNEFANGSNLLVFQGASFVYGLLTNIWALVISVRKARLLKNIDQQAAKAHWLLMGVNIGFIVMCVVAVIFGFYSPIGYWTFFIFIWLCNLAQIVIYISYSAVPASFQVKIAGFSFVSIVTFLTVVTLVFFPPLIPTEIDARVAQQEGLRNMFFIIAAAALFVVTILPGLLRKSLATPLARLLVGVKAVNAGDLKVQVAVGSPDEIGALTENFNQMTRSLQKANEQLRDYADQLEKKVTERTAALNASLRHLQDTQAQLVHAEKMASLGELTAGIAHEIQNPLNFVNNFSDLSADLLRELEECLDNSQPEDAREIVQDLRSNLQKIMHHGGRAAGIVKNMLEHSNAGNGQRTLADVNQLCRQYAELSLKAMKMKDQTFTCLLQFELDPGVGQLEIISQDISRVLQNVCNNAFYAVRQKEKTLAKQGIPFHPCVGVSTIAQRNNQGVKTGIEIRVSDNGTGIPEGAMAKIFQPFYTTKPTGEGTGLGLSMSYDIIIKGHGGMMRMESIEGEGTVMIISLPAVMTQAEMMVAPEV